MSKRISFTTADNVGEVQLHPTKRLTLLSEERKHQLTGALNPMTEQARQQKMLSFISKNIDTIDESSQLLTRVGAYIFMFSQIENRLRAMYRQRYAVMMGHPAPKSTDDQQGHTLNNSVETQDLQQALLLLRDYEDIDAVTTKELVLLIAMRNKLVHQALYRTDAFKIDAIPALLELYSHLVRIRARLTTRINKERKLYHDVAQVQSIVRQQLADIPLHGKVARLDVFERTGGSPTVSVPIMSGQPLYLVAKESKSTALQVKVGDEVGHHALWDTLIGQNTGYVVFQKHTEGSTVKVKRLGEGIIESAERDTNGRYKFLNIRLV